MVLKDQEENPMSPLFIAFLEYLGGRIDAADRRSEVALGLASALLAYEVAQFEVGVIISSPFASFHNILFTLSMLCLIGSAGSALWASRAQVVEGNSWPSDLFLSRKSPNEIIANVCGLEGDGLAGLVEVEMALAKICRHKNYFANLALFLFCMSILLHTVAMIFK